ncbi:MAG: SPOR domain-containing protein, partial [Variibacter sp.]|nr:SPOR domain-containing protein [Variibacter sp.]
SGFNLVTSMKRGNRYLVGVVLGGRSGGSRDAIMRNLLAEHLDEAATRRTVAAIVERNVGDAKVADARGFNDDDAKALTRPEAKRPAPTAQGPVQLASTASEPVPLPAPRTPANAAEAADRPAPAPLTSGVIASQTLPAIPGSAEPMTPVRVKTVQVRMGQTRVASAAPAPISTSAIPPARKPETAETSKAVVASAEVPAEARPASRSEPWATSYAQPRGDFPAPLPTQPKTVNGIGQVVIGAPVPAEHAQAMAYADPMPRGAPPTSLNAQAAALQAAEAAPQPAVASPPVQQQPAPAAHHASTSKPAVRSGWIIQVGALESESEARMRLSAARGTASKLLSGADPFTETVSKGNKTLYRARFAGLSQDSAEAACRALKRSEISCIAIRN